MHHYNVNISVMHHSNILYSYRKFSFTMFYCSVAFLDLLITQYPTNQPTVLLINLTTYMYRTAIAPNTSTSIITS